MSHNQNESVLSPLTSISSRDSIEIYESLKDGIADVEHSQTTLQELVRDAEEIITKTFAAESDSTYTYQNGRRTASVSLDKVMSAMLVHAEECGGKQAKRYVASAVVACRHREDAVKALAALSFTWLTQFLFIFITSRSRESESDPDLRELTTPTLDATASHLGEDVGHVCGSFPEDVMMRDGYKCILTGYQDRTHPSPDTKIHRSFLKPCRIIPREIGQFSDERSDSAFTTFDILARYARLPREVFEDMQNRLDGPSNGMMLESSAREAYANFLWCLRSTGTDSVYAVKIFEDIGIYALPPDNLVTFRDQSNDFGPPDAAIKQNRAIPLPNPRYLAIHAAIAGILHMSGAGKFFDQLLDYYKDDEGMVPPVRSWTELDGGRATEGYSR